jgi:septum formation protein
MTAVRENFRIILASKSPRRKYLLEQAGLHFSAVPSCVDEQLLEVCEPERYVCELSEAKAMDVAQRFPSSWVIGADTIVCVENTILGKPSTMADARQMLQKLSGRIHQVYTGISFVFEAAVRKESRCIITDVEFKTLSHKEIEWYIRTGEPFDKAGAYAIQGMGTFLVRRICGSYTNVVGLPVCEVIEFLIKEGVIGFDETDAVQCEDAGQCMKLGNGWNA